MGTFRTLRCRLHELLNNILSKEAEEIKRIIKEYDTVSFDVFDTLILRDVVEPEDVFFMVQKKYNLKHEKKIDNFPALRIKAENYAKKVSQFEEISIEKIYSVLNMPEKIKKELFLYEMYMEEALCTQNMRIKQIYDVCVSENKNILFISDMYLPEKVIKRMLEKSGYEKGRLFLSSKYKKTKRRGSLYEIVKSKMNINTWLHIGDNVISDFMVAKKHGINAIIIKKNYVHLKYYNKKVYRKKKAYATLEKFINNRIGRYNNPYEEFGYEILGPILYGFAKWMKKNVNTNEKIIFLAREGELIQKAFNIISPKGQTSYVHISRHAASVPRLFNFNTYKEFCDLFENNIHRVYSVNEFCKECELSGYKEIIFNRLGISGDEVCSQKILRFIITNYGDLIKDNSIRQRKLLKKYMWQMGLNEENVIVDVGWRGTIQRYLVELFKDETDKIGFRGLYIGTIDELNSNSKFITKSGYLDTIKNKYFFDVLAYTLTFFEMLFLSAEGTTESYKEDKNGIIVPVLGKAENLHMKSKICVLQSAALDFVKDMHSSQLFNLLNVTPDNVMENYIRMAVKADKKTLSMFMDLKVYDGSEYYFISKKNLLYYILHFAEFKRDFLNNRCKLWFLKSIFKLPLPYVYLLDLLKKFDREKMICKKQLNI